MSLSTAKTILRLWFLTILFGVPAFAVYSHVTNVGTHLALTHDLTHVPEAMTANLDFKHVVDSGFVKAVRAGRKFDYVRQEHDRCFLQTDARSLATGDTVETWYTSDEPCSKITSRVAD